MAGNVEIKAVVTSLEAIAEALSRLDAGEGVDLVQEDTFFECPRGRLKLRKIAPGAGELIHYERPDEPGPKSSTYTRVSTTEPDRLCDLLDAAYGTVGVVRKRRTLRLVGRTRVHLDTVEHLGTFVELEVVGGLRAVGAGSSRGTQPDGGAGHRREPARWRRVHRPAAGADLTVSARSRGSGRARPARRTIGGDSETWSRRRRRCASRCGSPA